MAMNWRLKWRWAYQMAVWSSTPDMESAGSKKSLSRALSNPTRRRSSRPSNSADGLVDLNGILRPEPGCDLLWVKANSASNSD